MQKPAGKVVRIAALPLVLTATDKLLPHIPAPHKDMPVITATNPHEDPRNLLNPNIFNRTFAEAPPTLEKEETTPTLSPTEEATEKISKIEQIKNELKEKCDITLSSDSNILHSVLNQVQMYPPAQRQEMTAAEWDIQMAQEVKAVFDYLPSILTDPQGSEHQVTIIATKLPRADQAFTTDDIGKDLTVIVINTNKFAAGQDPSTHLNTSLLQTLGHEMTHIHKASLTQLEKDIEQEYSGITVSEGLRNDINATTNFDPNSTTTLTDAQKEQLVKETSLLHAETDSLGPMLVEYALGGEKYFRKQLAGILPPERIDHFWEILQKYVFSSQQ